MKSLRFSIVQKEDFALPVVSFYPPHRIDKGWRLDRVKNGLSGNDGITGFAETFIREVKKVKEGESSTLFIDEFSAGSSQGQPVLPVCGEDLLMYLFDKALADPNLLWMLHEETGQKTLKYIFDTFGVKCIGALRRVIVNPNNRRFFLFLCRFSDGSWHWRYISMRTDLRSLPSPPMILRVL